MIRLAPGAESVEIGLSVDERAPCRPAARGRIRIPVLCGFQKVHHVWRQDASAPLVAPGGGARPRRSRLVIMGVSSLPMTAGSRTGNAAPGRRLA